MQWTNVLHMTTLRPQNWESLYCARGGGGCMFWTPVKMLTIMDGPIKIKWPMIQSFTLYHTVDLGLQTDWRLIDIDSPVYCRNTLNLEQLFFIVILLRNNCEWSLLFCWQVHITSQLITLQWEHETTMIILFFSKQN